MRGARGRIVVADDGQQPGVVVVAQSHQVDVHGCLGVGGALPGGDGLVRDPREGPHCTRGSASSGDTTGRPKHWISALRDYTTTLACLRLGHPTAYAKGAHLLPDEQTTALATTLVRAMTEPELCRAYNAAVTVATAGLHRWSPELATRVGPMLMHLTEHTPKARTSKDPTSRLGSR